MLCNLSQSNRWKRLRISRGGWARLRLPATACDRTVDARREIRPEPAAPAHRMGVRLKPQNNGVATKSHERHYQVGESIAAPYEVYGKVYTVHEDLSVRYIVFHEDQLESADWGLAALHAPDQPSHARRKHSLCSSSCCSPLCTAGGRIETPGTTKNTVSNLE
jgi:hypothetical protein